jgi:hypothetical protein
MGRSLRVVQHVARDRRWLLEGTAVGLAMALAAGCGGREQSNREPPDAGDAAFAADTADATDASSPARVCTTDDDCTAVLDYRHGFTCWYPSAASKADVSADPCLVPWTPNPRCTTPPPPAGCPSGPIAVQHSCPALQCEFPTCNEGTCQLDLRYGTQCPVVDAGPPDCVTLQAAYAKAAVAAQSCDPTQDASACAGEYPDSCGCEAPFSVSGRPAEMLQCAFDDVMNAHCSFPTCGETCVVVPPSGAATCVANASGSSGTCAWAK